VGFLSIWLAPWWNPAAKDGGLVELSALRSAG